MHTVTLSLADTVLIDLADDLTFELTVYSTEDCDQNSTPTMIEVAADESLPTGIVQLTVGDP